MRSDLRFYFGAGMLALVVAMPGCAVRRSVVTVSSSQPPPGAPMVRPMTAPSPTYVPAWNGTRMLKPRYANHRLTLSFSKPIRRADCMPFVLTNPPRVAVDTASARWGGGSQQFPVGKEGVRAIKFGDFQNQARAVIVLDQPIAWKLVQTTPKRIDIVLIPGKPVVFGSGSPAPSPAPNPTSKLLSLRCEKDRLIVQTNVSVPYEDSFAQGDDRRVLLTLHTGIPPSVKAIPGAGSIREATIEPMGTETHITLWLAKPALYRIETTDGGKQIALIVAGQ